VAAFWSFHKMQTEVRRRQEEIPQLMERLLADGIEALDRMVAAQKADPQRLGPWGEQIDEVGKFFNRSRQLLIDHNKRSLLDDLGASTRMKRDAGSLNDRTSHLRSSKNEKTAARKSPMPKRWKSGVFTAAALHRGDGSDSDRSVEGIGEARLAS
jgi:DNA-binding protein H-NS